jgi:hypothetical protein
MARDHPPTTRRANSMDPVRVYCYTYIRPDPMSLHHLPYLHTAHETNHSMPKMWEEPQSTHRVAMATLWLTFHHDGKNQLNRRGGGCTPSPFHSIYNHEQRPGLWFTLQLRGQIHSPYFISISICTLWKELILYF